MVHDGQAQPALALPALMMSTSDVSRVRRELSALEEYLQAQRLRDPGLPMERLPKTSRLLEELVTINSVNLLHQAERQELARKLDALKTGAPIIHISFASDPSSASLQKIVFWLRQNIRPDVLVQVGLQPTVVAGCVMRTTNQYFDFSLRKYLQDHRDYLVKSLTPSASQPTNTAEVLPEQPYE